MRPAARRWRGRHRTRPEDAIDDQEHDLAVLRRLLDEPQARVRGHAHYLLSLNENLRRSVIDRWARGQNRWSPSDGLTRSTPRVAPALAPQRLTARAYSLSALQKFSACPYQFALSAIYRLQPLERPEPLQRMDPLTRGSIFHEIQARFLRQLRSSGDLPVTAANMETARAALVVGRSPAWRMWPTINWRRPSSACGPTRWPRSGGIWKPGSNTWSATGPSGRRPSSNSRSGGCPGSATRAASRRTPCSKADIACAGAIDLVEEHRQTGLLRVTDHKTGRKPERIERLIIGGGSVLQPILYPLAIEATLQRPVHHGRLFYCTSAGSFYPHRSR